MFRHGSIFDSFIDEEIDPDRILEAMFGQTERQGAHRHRHPGSERHSAAEIYDFEAKKKQRTPKVHVGRIKIVEAGEEGETSDGSARAAAPGERIKVVYFDD